MKSHHHQQLGIRHGLFLVLISCSLLSTLSQASASVLLFAPSNVDASTAQMAFGEACPLGEVLAFGHRRDFWRIYQQSSPSVIISTGIVFEQLSGYQMLLRGAINSTASEALFLVSLDEIESVDVIEGKTVGVLGVLKRRALVKYYSSLLGFSVRAKSVAKPRDLLPLLNFGLADGVIVGERTVDYLREVSNQKFFALPLNVETGISVVALKQEAEPSIAQQVMECIKSLPAQVNRYFGVDTWAKP